MQIVLSRHMLDVGGRRIGAEHGAVRVGDGVESGSILDPRAVQLVAGRVEVHEVRSGAAGAYVSR